MNTNEAAVGPRPAKNRRGGWLGVYPVEDGGTSVTFAPDPPGVTDCRTWHGVKGGVLGAEYSSDTLEDEAGRVDGEDTPETFLALGKDSL